MGSKFRNPYENVVFAPTNQAFPPQILTFDSNMNFSYLKSPENWNCKFGSEENLFEEKRKLNDKTHKKLESNKEIMNYKRYDAVYIFV